MTFFTLTFSNGAAQQKRKMSWEAPAADTKYTQQLALDVGDIPGHQVATSARDECLIVREGLDLEGKPVPDGRRGAATIPV